MPAESRYAPSQRTPERQPPAVAPASASPGLGARDRRELRALFDALDVDGDGTVSADEIRYFFSATGSQMTQEEVARLVEAVTQQGAASESEISFEQFQEAMRQAMSRQRRRRPSTHLGEADVQELWKVDARAPWRRDLSDLLEDPLSSRAAAVVGAVIMVAVMLSCVAFVLQSLRTFYDRDNAAWEAIELVCIVLFSLEYAVRLGVSEDRRRFVLAPLNVVDLLAVVPFYAELALSGERSTGSALLRVVRLVRVFRVLKISRYLSWANVFLAAFRASLAPLAMCLFVFALTVVFSSSAIYYAERGEPGTPYSSIPQSFWWCVITMTTVGFGDMVPATVAGKLIAGFTSVAGILILAVPISVISANFQSEYDAMLRRAELRSMRHAPSVSTRRLSVHRPDEAPGSPRASIRRRRSVDRGILMDALDDVTERFNLSFHMALTDSERGTRGRLLERMSRLRPFEMQEKGVEYYGSLP